MNNPLPRRTTLSLLPLLLGVWPALQNWTLAKALLCLWGMLWAASFFLCSSWASRLRNLLLFAAGTASLWGLLNSVHIPQSDRWGIGYAILLIVFFLQARWIGKRTDSSYEFWPSRNRVITSLFFLITFWLLLHAGMSFYLNKPFELQWWSPLIWSGLAFCLLYPKTVDAEWSAGSIRLLRAVLPLFLAMVLLGQGYRYRQMEARLTAGNDPASLAEEAFAAGYRGLGVDAAVRETLRRKESQGWADALSYLRRQWLHESKIAFARAWRKHPAAQNDLFFLTTCFGGSLQLQPREEALDWAVLPQSEQIWVLTSDRRVLRLDKDGLHCIPLMSQNVRALAVHEPSQTLAILMEGYLLVRTRTEEQLLIPLPPNVPGRDLAWLPDGERLWILSELGEVWEMGVYDPSKRTPAAPIHPALWSDLPLARSLLVLDEDSCLVLDRCGGVHPRGETSAAKWDEKELSKHYHPERPVMTDLVNGLDAGEFLILNQSGWVHPIASPRPIMQVLFPPGEAVALAALPQANTLLQLLRDGTIFPYAMPQGAPVIFYDKSARISTECQ